MSYESLPVVLLGENETVPESTPVGTLVFKKDPNQLELEFPDDD